MSASVNTGSRIRSYLDLKVWVRSMDLFEKCSLIANHFPPRSFGWLADQLRRAAFSIPANIAEGHGSGYRAIFLRHLSIANGSLKEVETALAAAMRTQMLTTEEFKQMFVVTTEVGKMLRALRTALKKKPTNP